MPGDAVTVLPNLILGSAKAAHDRDGLRAAGVTHIVSLAGRVAFEGEYIYHRAHFADTPGAPMGAVLIGCCEFIAAAFRLSDKTRVLVHCQGGVSRSPAVVAAFLSSPYFSRQLSLADALTLVGEKRPGAKFKADFIAQIEAFLLSLKDMPGTLTR